MKTPEILPHFALLLDCADALNVVDIDRWDQFSPQQRRGAGII